jgi:lipopolysaccharide transport system ATP-binding protein
MLSKVLIPQVTLDNEEGYGLTATDGDVAISVHNVGKMYYLYDRPQDRLKQAFLWGRKKLYREFWALRDISFEVKRGETVGIIGQNGSGKSTLLQIIAGTLTPTTGEIQVNGRVTALLELGAGFNPEFTGRENVYMNGAILGISEAEMRERFDDITAFADIGEFIDQPVKIYSSGMYVRLAFAIATSVEPDILIVDEALAVGDVYFQQRCMRRMREFKESGKAIIFVTHDPAAVKSLCDRAIWLNQGRIRDVGAPERVVGRYLAAVLFDQQEREVAQTTLPQSEVKQAVSEGQQQVTPSQEALPPETVIPNIDRRFGDERAEIIGIGVYDENNQKVTSIAHGRTVQIRVSVHFKARVPQPIVGYILRDRLGVDVGSSNTYIEGVLLPPGQPGDIYTVRFVVDLPLLCPGPYSLAVAISDGDANDHIWCDWVDNIFVLQVLGEKLVYPIMRFPTHCYLEAIGKREK